MCFAASVASARLAVAELTLVSDALMFAPALMPAGSGLEMSDVI